ncbi:protoporphyrinogen oxidase [Desulfurispira natronophila]|uniref:Coproporphyrinogen III oxidase n=1 Tax=Desulfurispira natronophila TaxID=682562 RepID=A0A7W7Y5Z1_9BACT|nr:protoporphyrinogen oxidase [Desulfurispira natronophila]MBB5022720.1 oxygen-dependent protoporphyrinogen oxidase [Desulfurispira natronophila]
MSESQRIAVIGGGLSGLSTAYYLHKARPDLRIILYEASTRPGGKIQTLRDDFTCESGPNGFLDSRTEILELSRELGLEARLLPANADSARRFIFSCGTLHEIQPHPVKFMSSPLLSLKGKLRLAMEAVAPKPQGDDETLEEFGCRKLGREAFERLIDPMASGVYAGDPSRMSVKACFPRIYEMDRQYGSLTKALFAIKKEKRQAGEASSGPAGPGGLLTSFKNGLGEIIEALHDQCGATLRLEMPVIAIERDNDKFIVKTSTCADRYDAVVCATPAWNTASMVAGLHSPLADKLQQIESSPINVIALAFNREELSGGDTHGFGFLVPGKENRQILGCLWSSSIFKYRAPQDAFLVQCMVGGARQHDLASLEDPELVKLVREELKLSMGIEAEPIYSRVFRWSAGIPQYNMGHTQLVEELEALCREEIQGFYLTGNSYRGIAVNDCVVDAQRLAEEILATDKDSMETVNKAKK